MTQKDQLALLKKRLVKHNSCIDLNVGRKQYVLGRFPFCGSKLDGKIVWDEPAARYLLGFTDKPPC